MEDNSRPSKRTRKSCERCRHRKQKCHGFPVCSNCANAKEECIQSASAIEEYNSGPNQALLERISYLESKLAERTNSFDSNISSPEGTSEISNKASLGSTKTLEGRQNLAEIAIPFNPKENAASVGRRLMATSLGQITETLFLDSPVITMASTIYSKPTQMMSLQDNVSDPRNQETGRRMLDAYFTRVHLRYPFLDRKEVLELHTQSAGLDDQTVDNQFRTFKLYMVYAIGSSIMKVTEQYDYTSSETFLVKALQNGSSICRLHSVHKIESVILFVLYNLYSGPNIDVWQAIGLAVRMCLELGLHREGHYEKIAPYRGQLLRRIFWTAYSLERLIAVSLGRPFSISDKDIDVQLPLEIDDSLRDDGLIARTLAVVGSPSFQASRPSSNMTLAVRCFQLRKLESTIRSTIYRIDRPVSDLMVKIKPLLNQLEDWRMDVMLSAPYEVDYLNIYYYKAIKLLLQPFLTTLEPSDPLFTLCLQAAGQVCQSFKDLCQRESIGSAFAVLQSVFLAGLTTCYCLYISPSSWSATVSDHLNTCRSSLSLIAERVHHIKKYNDVLEAVGKATMVMLTISTSPFPTSPNPTVSSQNNSSSLAPQAGPPQNVQYQSSPFTLALPVSAHESSVRWSMVKNKLSDSGKSPSTHHLQYAGSNIEADVAMGSRSLSSPQASITNEASSVAFLPGETRQMDARWILSLCPECGFSMPELTEMLRFEPILGP